MKYFCLILCAVFTLSLSAQDAQWRGPDRNGIYPDTGLLKVWPEDGPELLLSIKGIGKGYSSAVATDRKIFVSGLKDTLDMCMAYDFGGNLVWEKPIGAAWNNSFPESRSTPTVDNERIYVLSGLDNLVCFNAENGDEIWSVDLHKTFGSNWDMFGVSESVHLLGDKVICTPAGDQTTVIALNKYTGELIWKSESMGGQRSNASSTLFQNDTMGLNFIVTATRTHTIGVDPESGEILWKYHYNILDEKEQNSTIHTNTPLFHSDEILISSGWDYKTVMLEVAEDGRSVSEKYIDNTLDNQNHGLVLLDGYVYGSNFLTRNKGKWVCMNWDTGEIMWVEEWNNKGPILSADGMLYLYDERGGNIGLVSPGPDRFELVSSFKIKGGSGPHWARPSIYGGKLFVRHGDTLLIYNLKA